MFVVGLRKQHSVLECSSVLKSSVAINHYCRGRVTILRSQISALTLQSFLVKPSENMCKFCKCLPHLWDDKDACGLSTYRSIQPNCRV